MFMDNTKARRNHSRRALAHMKRKRMKVWRKTDTRQWRLAADRWNYLLSEWASCLLLDSGLMYIIAQRTGKIHAHF